MKSFPRWVPVVAGVVWLCSVSYAVVTGAAEQAAPAGKASTLRLYTDAQAKRGHAAVVQQCVSCHSEDLNGGQGDLDLSNERFLYRWGNVSLGDLANIIQTTMPVYAPNTLTVQQSTDIVAYVLWLNAYPTGDKELPADVEALRKITLQTPEEHFRLFTQ
jgi:mono/diheme cytochrome c family protein